jgi:hypothetical protein
MIINLLINYCEPNSSHAGCERRGSNSGAESDEDNEEGDYTVYECPGLAPVSLRLDFKQIENNFLLCYLNNA